MAHATPRGMPPGHVAWTLLLLSSPFAAGEASSGHANRAMCSLVPLEMRMRLPGAVAFLGTVSADTILAGPGAKQPVVEPGHYGPGTPRTIYGQSARVERLEQRASSALKEAIATNRSIVIVPWDYSASCQRVPWTRTARWLTPDTRGTFVAELRDREYWVNGRPTFDVTPEVAVYPSPWPRRAGRRLPDGPALSAEEFLSLYEVLPDWRSLDVSPDSAVAPLLRWAQMFPEIAAKQPAAHMLEYLRHQVVEERYKNQTSPLAGTYRVIFRTAAGDSSIFFARTELHPTSVIHARDPVQGVRASRRGQPIVGHYLLASVARTIGELPTRRTGAVAREGYLAVVDSAIARTDSAAVYSGSIDMEREAGSLVSDSLARRRLEEAGRQKSAALTQLFRSGQTGTPGRFVMTPSGDLRFEMIIHHEGTPVLTVHADRISREHLQVRAR